MNNPINEATLGSWFKGSVMVGTSGRPKVYYHGSDNSNITKFTASEAVAVPAICFAGSPSLAEEWGHEIYRVLLRMKNPFYGPLNSDYEAEETYYSGLKQQGYDGILYGDSPADKECWVAVFNENDILIVDRDLKPIGPIPENFNNRKTKMNKITETTSWLEGFSKKQELNYFDQQRKERFPNRENEGLLGPLHMRNGRTYYYDTRAGKYYDPITECYAYDMRFGSFNNGT